MLKIGGNFEMVRGGFKSQNRFGDWCNEISILSKKIKNKKVFEQLNYKAIGYY